jgi:energy-converting hydrogenase B subunit I
MNEARNLLSAAAMALIALMILASLAGLSRVVEPGVSEIYNRIGPLIAPNMVTVILFDWRGFDTLGECLVLVTGVLVTALVFGRGSLSVFHSEELEGEDVKPTPILYYFTPLVMLLVVVLGVYLTLGGHITPGGGFQGGSLIATGVLIGLAVYGRKNLIEFSHTFLNNLETFGVLLYILLGLTGLMLGGYFLYNPGVNLYELVPADVASVFNYPDVTGPGIIPYLNMAVLLKVSAGLSTILLVLVGVRK